jgi:hypothetical protein
MSRFQSRTGERLRWRVIVQTAGRLDASRASRPLAWHLVECVAPTRLDAHCPEGQRMLETGGDPDGHCLIDDVCPRCAMEAVPVPPPPVAVTPPTVQDTPVDSNSGA